MVEAPMLIYHYPTTTYILDIDASNTPQVTLLSQMVEGDERVVAYYSKMFKPTPKNCCYPEWVDGGDYVPASLRYYFIYLAVHVCGVNPSGSHVAQVPSRVRFWIGALIGALTKHGEADVLNCCAYSSQCAVSRDDSSTRKWIIRTAFSSDKHVVNGRARTAATLQIFYGSSTSHLPGVASSGNRQTQLEEIANK